MSYYRRKKEYKRSVLYSQPLPAMTRPAGLPISGVTQGTFIGVKPIPYAHFDVLEPFDPKAVAFSPKFFPKPQRGWEVLEPVQPVKASSFSVGVVRSGVKVVSLSSVARAARASARAARAAVGDVRLSASPLQVVSPSVRRKLGCVEKPRRSGGGSGAGSALVERVVKAVKSPAKAAYRFRPWC